MAVISSRPPAPQSGALAPPAAHRASSARTPGSLVLLLVLLGALGLAFYQFRLPAVTPASVPRTEFSAARAMADLHVIAQAPRPLGSPGHTSTRDYLVAQLRALGLDPQIQAANVVGRFPDATTFNAAYVQNVVVRLPGTASSGAILLDGHYDGGNTGPAASDCGSCVVTLLETLRAIQAGPPLKNDLIFVFADGEENGDLGARAFATQHPWMRDVALALNFEAQGSGGPAALYVTSPQNAWLVDQFRTVAPDPLAISLNHALLSYFPGMRPGCDLEEYMDRGAAGISFIYNGDTPAYHTMRDSVTVTDPRSIQQEGSYTVALVRQLGNLDLRAMPRDEAAVFFNLWPGVVAAYPVAWAMPLALVVALGFLAVALLGFRRRLLTPGGLALGALLYAVFACVAFLVAVGVWLGLKALDPAYQVFLVGFYGGGFVLAGLCVLSVALLAGVYTWLRGLLRGADLAAGAFLVLALLTIALAAGAPGASYLLTWPLLVGLAALAWAFGQAARADAPVGPTWADIAVWSAASIPVIILVVPGIIVLFPWMSRLDALLGLPALAVPALLAVLLTGALLPQLALLSGEPAVARAWQARQVPGGRRGLVPAGLLLVALLLGTVGVLRAGYSSAHPRPDSIAYVLNADTGQAHWTSNDQRRDSYTAQFFPADMASAAYPTSAAPAVALPAPAATLRAATTDGSARELTLQLTSPRGAGMLRVEVRAQGDIEAATLAGQPLDLRPFRGASRNTLTVNYYGLTAAGIALRLRVKATAPITVRLQDASDGLPALPGFTLQPRSAEQMPAPAGLLDPTRVERTFQF